MFPFKLTPKRVAYLKQLELDTCEEVVHYFPRGYNSYELSKISKELDGQRVVIKGIVKSKERVVHFGRNKTILKFKVISLEDEYTIVAFNRPYLGPNIVQGEEVIVVGKLSFYRKEINLVEVVTKGTDKLEIKPLYRLVEGVTNYEFQQVLKLCFEQVILCKQLEEIVPQVYRDKYRLINRRQAYFAVHFPKTKEELHQGLRYLKYEELLVYSLALQRLKSLQKTGSISTSKKVDLAFVNQVISTCPFTLTSDQEIAVKEIINDLRNSGLMYRMLQGDVGCGKTLVALLGLVANYSANYQGMLMAPTDILARQHYDFTCNFLSEYPIRVGLLVSSMPAKEKKEIYRKLANKEIDIIVGTHALIQDGVEYANLGLAVIDEQHRFGVKQRQVVKEKGENVELLMMSATPIPRTLAITLYGDMDISTLHTFPNQKRDVTTKVIVGDSIKPLLKEIKQRIDSDERIFIVCPLIEDDDERRNVTSVYEGLVKYSKDEYGIGLLHGKMDDSEKEEIMHKFINGEISILVATTVIEVGIDIKKASMMIIYDAQSFGLATLHQLRGRIGRGGQQANCYLLCNGGGDVALKRLEYLQDHDDGFDIARFDLANRGPGDIMGIRQSGIPDLNVADLYDDLRILEIARDDARKIMLDPSNPDNKQIIAYVSRIKT